jgi:hypothetical protein
MVVRKKSADINEIALCSISGVLSVTYEQALRGLFTIGTSSLESEIPGKGRWQTGIDSGSTSRKSLQHRGINKRI